MCRTSRPISATLLDRELQQLDTGWLLATGKNDQMKIAVVTTVYSPIVPGAFTAVAWYHAGPRSPVHVRPQR